ncbi:hypothetical protein IWT25_02333 [Secundilactobacillus pentosiphilus]|uniref:Uncharacterized protein n=1 Tax=Secundilactobacillus pentosiphilus TaxID=1714682 RepID=A0A1Z5IYX0_9LACO|nr:hypothetical protein [Secundilactobacillus pentosiphilus]GAX06985.1 hypothetical protein IWT25_02333 [Secundilactobacillus pentosiphilus]
MADKQNDESLPDKEVVLHRFLNKFSREEQPYVLSDLEKPIGIGEKIVQLLKKEDVTYDDAYASLQYAYELLKYKSNFINL